MSTPKKNQKKEKSGGPKFKGYWIYIFLFVNIIIAYVFINRQSQPNEITWQTFKQTMLSKHDVAKVQVVNKEMVEVYIKQDSLKKKQYKDIATTMSGSANPGPHYYFQIGSVDAFEHNMEEAQSSFPETEKVPITYISRGNIWSGVLSWIIPLGIILLFWYFLSGRISSSIGKAGSSAFDFGKTRAQEYGKGKISPVTFKDVAGYEEAKVEVMEIVDFLKHPENFTKLGAKIPKGVLLVGPPGTGKTLMAKAVAGEAAVPFFSLSGSEFIEIYVGVGASRVRDLFEKAKQKAPSIIFIDEIDAIGRVRGHAVSAQANDERESTLNQLLAEMDGFDANTGVIVMAATNRGDILDPALLRAGRFDRHVYLELPNKQERTAIFKVHLKPLILDPTIDSEFLAAQTPGFSGADIANVCNEAALIAARHKKDTVELEDFYNAIDRIVAGLEKKSKIISPAERRIIAYHEAGHAVTSWMLKHVDSLVKVSIIPRGKSLGSAWYMPEEKQIITKAQFKDQLCASLGGRVAEEIVFGEISSGALDDLEKVTRQAYMMVANLGLSDKLGYISFYDSTGAYSNSFQKPYSEATAKLIDDEVHDLIEEAHQRTRNVLTKERNKLDALAKLLLEKEIVQKDDLERILGKRDNTENVVNNDSLTL